MARRATAALRADLKVAENGDRIQAGRILFAPSSAHFTVLPGGRVRIDDGAPSGVCPSVDITFTTIAETYGARAAGVLLTGMGTDGATGLLAIRHAGGTTVVQDEASCVVFGMPRAAINLDAAQSVLPPSGLIRSRGISRRQASGSENLAAPPRYDCESERPGNHEAPRMMDGMVSDLILLFVAATLTLIVVAMVRQRGNARSRTTRGGHASGCLARRESPAGARPPVHLNAPSAIMTPWPAM